MCFPQAYAFWGVLWKSIVCCLAEMLLVLLCARDVKQAAAVLMVSSQGDTSFGRTVLCLIVSLLKEYLGPFLEPGVAASRTTSFGGSGALILLSSTFLSGTGGSSKLLPALAALQNLAILNNRCCTHLVPESQALLLVRF